MSLLRVIHRHPAPEERAEPVGSITRRQGMTRHPLETPCRRHRPSKLPSPEEEPHGSLTARTWVWLVNVNEVEPLT